MTFQSLGFACGFCSNDGGLPACETEAYIYYLRLFGRKLGSPPTIFGQLFKANRECTSDCVDAAGVAVDVAQSV